MLHFDSGDYMKKVSASVSRVVCISYIIFLSGCLYTTDMAFYAVENATKSQVTILNKFAKQSDFEEVFKLQPGEAKTLIKYEETPGDTSSVFKSWGQIQIVADNNCKVVLNAEQITKYSMREKNTYRWVLKVNETLLKNENCN